MLLDTLPLKILRHFHRKKFLPLISVWLGVFWARYQICCWIRATQMGLIDRITFTFFLERFTFHV